MIGVASNIARNALNIATKCSCQAVIVTRGRRQWVKPYLQSLYKRRVDQGPEPERPRSVWINWNYDAEIFAFGKRLGEEFDAVTLKRAFITSSFVRKENERRVELGLEGDQAVVQLEDNAQLAQLGEDVAQRYIIEYLKNNYPLIPQDCIQSVANYLWSDEVLLHIASNIGIKDLIQTAEFPVMPETLVLVLKAVIGALQHDGGQRQAELFVQDFILTQLIGKDLLELCDIKNPMGLLTDILRQLKQSEPEPRLLWSTGSSTILATYIVGIYCDQQLIGQAPGETVTIAEEMAARDALRRFLKVTDSRPPHSLGINDHKMQLS